ncbi:MAG: hypothetical protein ACRD3C_05790 [Vicinamibacterales bacterium]
MNRWSDGWRIALGTVGLIVALAPAPPAAQGAAGTTYTPPRTRDGHPDLQGVWQVLNAAAWNVEDHAARIGVPGGYGVVDGGAIPYQPWALARRQENFANRATLDPETKCYLPGVPRITYMPHPFRIVQQANRVTILYEYLHAVRYVFMNGNPHPEGPIEWWMGDSRGRWEGNTLVVDVIHLSDRTWLDRAGNFHSEALHVVERYTPSGPDHILYEATLDDPKVFTRPWTMSMTLYRRQGKNGDLMDSEYDCYPDLLEQEWDKPGSTFFAH